MGKYLIRRILIIIPTLVLVILLVFILVSLTPANPGRTILGLAATEEQVDQLNEDLGYNRPMLVRYVDYLWNLVRGDMGVSYYNQSVKVFDKVMESLPYTLTLTGFSILVAVLIGVSLGIACAVKQYSALDSIGSTVAMIMSSLPSFWVGIMLLLLFAQTLGWLPAGGVKSGFKSWILPVAIQGLIYAAQFLRYTRSAMLDQIQEDYVRTARSKGCSEKRVVFGHALRNALLTIITVIATNMGYMMGGSVVLESIFGIPGLGFIALEAILKRDIPIVLGAILTIAILFMIIMLVVDVLYAIIDPRIKAQYTRGKIKKKKPQQLKTANQ
ncbi:MAG: ABC transporter permease [Ruminococcaceae bacterium]|nr:ABC transporter permease [Oscillospiraceae bacterium]